MRQLPFLRLLLVVLSCLMCLAPTVAFAHGGDVSGPTRTYTQAVGPYEVTLVVTLPPAAPAPLHIAMVMPQGVDGATFTFRATPRGQPFGDAEAAQVRTIAAANVYYTDVTVTQLGDWDLEVRADGLAGSGVALVPVTITAAPLPPYSIPLYVSIGVLVVLLLLGLVTSALFERGGRAAPRWVVFGLNQSAFAALICIILFGGLQWWTTAQTVQAANTAAAPYGRPHVNMDVRTTPLQAVVGEPMTLLLTLTDGGTGRPVDDLASHHDALVHLIILSDDGGYFTHVHPARSGAGEYAIEINPDRPGRYTAYAEIAREQSGTQIVARTFEVEGTSGSTDVPAESFGTRSMENMQVTIGASTPTIRVGEQTTLTFSFAKDGQPVLDLEPWLGMAGHLIVHDLDQVIFGHVHAAAPMAPSGVVGTWKRYGPDIQFAYTFPKSGVYQLWGQFQHQGKIITLPIRVEVAPLDAN